MTIAPKKVATKHRRVAFARAIEASAEGGAPSACRLWRPGVNHTDKGDLKFTERSARAVMQAYEKRGNPLVWYYDHEDRIPQAQRGGAPMKGACSAPSSTLEIRGAEDGPECWASEIGWTPEAKRQIETGERRQISPIAAYDEETREIIEIVNVSLCTEGATHSGTLLASREGSNMNEIVAKIIAAWQAMDWEALDGLIAEAESMDGGGAVADMAKAMKAAKGDDVPPPKDDAAEKRLAATLAASRTNGLAPGAFTAAFARELADVKSALGAATQKAEAAAKRSDRATVGVLIASRRDLFDAADEREHLNAADPKVTERFIASMDRKTKAGILVAGRADSAGAGEARAPGGTAVTDKTFGLSEVEMGVATQSGISFEAFAKSKAAAPIAARRGSN